MSDAESDRVKTGILGFDELIEGGLPRGYSYVLFGGPGTGKTTFAAQFLYKGATMYNDSGLYVTFDEPPYSIIKNMRRYNWNLLDEEKKGRLAFIDASPIKQMAGGPAQTFVPAALKQSFLGADKFQIDDVINSIREVKQKIGATRAVIDSVSALSLQFKEDFEQRSHLLRVIKNLTEMGLTTLLLSENQESETQQGGGVRFGPDAFLAQGVIVLHMFRVEESNVKALEIRKMRGVKHLERMCPYRMTPDGVEVYPEETVFRAQ